MPTGKYDQNNLAWQLYQGYDRLSQWWEYQQSRLNYPEINLPKWQWLNDELLLRLGHLIFWGLLILLSCWLALRILKLLQVYFQKIPSPDSQTRTKKNLKVITSQDWLEQAQQQQQRGNYREACICLYEAMLQLLDERQLISQQPSRTDGEYRRLTRNLPSHQAYQTLITAHQQLCFGQASASVQLWQRCQQAYQELLS